tara:strand:+ start:328 stop:669 length:342 start_codon:yes stop_codon:yes gene_type:complete
MVIGNDNIYHTTHKNSKTNYDSMMILITNFLSSKGIKIKDVSKLYINRGPGSYAGIRNSLSLAKAICLTNKIDYYCYSFKDFLNEDDIKHENIPNLCDKFKVKKNLINPIYLS